jgi:hypothetical protein
MAKKKITKKPMDGAGAGAEDKARAAKARIKVSGKTSRVKGHVSARTRRDQAKRDSK